MSNMCVIISKTQFLKGGIGIQLRWNGGRDSVEAFLEYCKIKRYPDISTGSGIAALSNVAYNFIGDGAYVKIDTLANLCYDNCDNGTYIVDGYEIVDRKWFDADEQNEYNLEEMLIDIDEAQPIAYQIGKYLKATPIKTEDIKIGDTIIGLNSFNEVFESEVVGIGGDNDYFVGIPYVAIHSKDNPASNINNYLTDGNYRMFTVETKEEDSK